MTEKPNNRGGARKGAGRKPDPNAKKTYGTKLNQDTIAFLRSLDNAAQFIDDTLQRTKAFKQWKRK